MKPKRDAKGTETKPLPKATQKRVQIVDEVLVIEEMKQKTDELIEKERGRLVDQMKDLIQELERLRRENDKLRRQQEQNMGVTAETVDLMRKRLDHARATNNFLIKDIEDRKNQLTRLETQSFEMTIKVESVTKKLLELQKENERRKMEVDQLTKDKSRTEKLMEENRKLRKFLASNHIDPRTGKPITDKYREERFAAGRKRVTIKSTPKEKSLVESKKRMAIGSSKSMDDIRKLEEYYDRMSAPIVDDERKISYGQYSNILKKRRSMQSKKSVK
ncbi:hypothetical protein FSP39_001574 [Pinctada imbricata]|uniref:Uncharacterized protein n=1 Tax=Pinctada imbricata TaxID=66713 RepID=A0AA89C051_PINIB|nr:hypothetical protein FSP39_001574 [Pinctada imbricata]